MEGVMSARWSRALEARSQSGRRLERLDESFGKAVITSENIPTPAMFAFYKLVYGSDSQTTDNSSLVKSFVGTT